VLDAVLLQTAPDPAGQNLADEACGRRGRELVPAKPGSLVISGSEADGFAAFALLSASLEAIADGACHFMVWPKWGVLATSLLGCNNLGMPLKPYPIMRDAESQVTRS